MGGVSIKLDTLNDLTKHSRKKNNKKVKLRNKFVQEMPTDCSNGTLETACRILIQCEYE